MGNRACLSRDGGRSWDVEDEVIPRADGFAGATNRKAPEVKQSNLKVGNTLAK